MPRVKNKNGIKSTAMQTSVCLINENRPEDKVKVTWANYKIQKILISSVFFQTVIHLGVQRTISSQKFTLISSFPSDLTITNYRTNKNKGQFYQLVRKIQWKWEISTSERK
jgi:hypothetical protein